MMWLVIGYDDVGYGLWGWWCWFVVVVVVMVVVMMVGFDDGGF